MYERPTVIITIPVFNGASYIGSALISAIGQTQPVDRIVVSDNCSDDATVSIVKGIIDENPEIDISLEINEQNLGYHRNLNKCIEYSSGFDYLLILYADDVLKPNIIEEHLKTFYNKPEYGFIASSEDKIDTKGNLIGSTSKQSDNHFNGGEIYEYVSSTGQYIADSSIMYDRKKIESVGYYKTDNIFSNELFNMEFVRRYPVLIKGQSFVLRRIHENNQLYDWALSRRREYIQAYRGIDKLAIYESRESYQALLRDYYRGRAVRAILSLAGVSVRNNKDAKGALVYLYHAAALKPMIIFNKSFYKTLIKVFYCFLFK
jgi:glycosyltransferase involved in cell wall biosynthesis